VAAVTEALIGKRVRLRRNALHTRWHRRPPAGGSG
jgi:hypothetical protein